MSRNDWKKSLYIANKIGFGYDKNKNSIELYSKPIPYKFNYQPISSEVDKLEFGEKAKMMQKAVITDLSYKDVFKENDLAYLDGATPIEEENNGDSANYRLYPPRNQNRSIVIYFERKTGK